MNNIYINKEMSKMESKVKILNAVKFVGGTILTIGVITFLLGLLVNGFSSLVLAGIGITMAAVFIFLMGVFFVATEEALEKVKHHENVR
jgi:hypothetical protein